MREAGNRTRVRTIVRNKVLDPLLPVLYHLGRPHTIISYYGISEYLYVNYMQIQNHSKDLKKYIGNVEMWRFFLMIFNLIQLLI